MFFSSLLSINHDGIIAVTPTVIVGAGINKKQRSELDDIIIAIPRSVGHEYNRILYIAVAIVCKTIL